MRDILLEVVVVVEQVVDEAHAVVAVDGLREASLAQVEVDQYGALADVGQRQGQVECRVGLTLAGRGRHGLYYLLAILQEEGDVGMQQAESLGDHVGAVGGDDNLVVDAGGGLLRNLTQDGESSHALHVGFGTQLGVEEADAEHYDGGQSKADDYCHKGEHHHLGCCEVDDGGFYHLGVADGDGQVHGGFLTLGEQVEVQLLFNLLLTRDLLDGFCLARHCCNLTASAGFLVAGLLGAHGGGAEQVVDSGLDGGQLVVHLLLVGACLRVVGTCGGLQALVLVDDAVVLGNHALYGGIADTDLGRDKLIAVEGVVDIAAHRADELQLGFQLDHLVVVACAGLHQLAGCALQFGKLRRALDGLDLCVDNVKFAADEGDTLRDELLGLLGHFVLVLHGIVVVDGNQGVHNVVGAVAVGVFEGDAEDGGHLVEAADRQAAYHVACHWVDLLHADVEGHAFAGLAVVGGFLNLEHHSVVEVDGLAILCLAFALEAGVGGAFFIEVAGGVGVVVGVARGDFQREGYFALFVLVVDRQGKRCVVVVGDFLEHVAAVAVVLKVQAGDHLAHQRR